MYKIQGADQKDYGPVTADLMRQWIAERRGEALDQTVRHCIRRWMKRSFKGLGV